MPAEVRSVEQYEWLVYLFNGFTLLFVGLYLIVTMVGAANTDKTLPRLIASLACIVMSLYFFAEAIFTKNKKEFSLDIISLFPRR
jgi:cytochrome c biogenesis protein CcdA